PPVEGLAGAPCTPRSARAVSAKPSVDGRHAAPILRPRGFVGADHRRTLLAVADGRDAIRRDAERDEHVLHRLGAALAEREVVLPRAALVAMTFDRHRAVGVLLHPGRLLLKDLARLRSDVGLVEGEIDAVAGRRREVLLRAGTHAAGRRLSRGG